MPMRRKQFQLFLVAILTVLMSATAQDTKVEDRVKASFIYNFLQYVDWPQQAFSSSTRLTICILGPAFQSVMDETVKGESIGGRAIDVKTLSAGDTERGCHLLYVRESAEVQPSQVMERLRAVRNFPVLTVGETSAFMQNGGIVRFVKTGSRIQFEINPSAASRASLTISSRLLRLAEIVHDTSRSTP